MSLTNTQLKVLVLGSNILTTQQFSDAENIAIEEKKSIEKVIVGEGLINEQNLCQLKANFLNIPFVNLSQTTIAKPVLDIVPELVAREQRVIAFKQDNQGPHLPIEDNDNNQIIEFIGKKTGLATIAYLTTSSDIDQALTLYTKDVAKAFGEIISENIALAKGSSTVEPPIIKLVDTIFDYAYQNKSSDIHIEPLEDSSLVRFRIDGILHDVVSLPVDLHPRIVTRIKVLAKLRTDEHQAAQDGKISYSTTIVGKKEDIDIRVSLVPITEGEKIVMRLLSARARQMSLEDLGLDSQDLSKLRNAYQKPHGMILSTGPTGSGKTTTLYVILQVLNQKNVNIMTIEDPVEYDIERINQIQVNEKANLNFSTGLRSIVRQDPDIILVGEIRDEETADIAINSAMTGHLVLSTLHTNNAATAVPRLLDLGVEPFLVSSSVSVIIGQRLVRKICEKCRASRNFSRDDLEKKLSSDSLNKLFGDKESITSYVGEGCDVCHQTGYSGRIGIFEILIMTEALKKAVVEKSDVGRIQEIAVDNGMTTMLEDGFKKILLGRTTLDEVLRVTKE